ncbi:MAG: hypothetical protein NC311_09050 [Muribaculaceae bacterium]|nr:hypothetical protein [Muribaculaceae bacterium]
MAETSAEKKHITLDAFSKAMARYHEKASAAWKSDIDSAGGGADFVGASEEEVLQVIEDIFASQPGA